MPLDESWWDPAGPFADNSVGGITAAKMRQFAQAIAEQGVTGSWFNLMFALQAITPTDWTTVNAQRVLWLKKTPAFDHSAEWQYAADAQLRDTYTYVDTNAITVQVTFGPSIIHVDHASIGTTMTPVAALTDNLATNPAPANTYAIGPARVIATAAQDIDVGGWASVAVANTERCVRFGMQFVPPAGKAIDAGASNFSVNATGAGVAVVSRPLAPGA